MTNLLSSFILVFLSCFPVVSHAFYVKGDAGGSIPTVKLKKQNGYIANKRMGSSPLYSLSAGSNIAEKLRIDVTLSHIANFKYEGTSKTKLGQKLTQKEKTKVDVAMFNAYWDVLKDKKHYAALSPFIGAGIGVAQIKHKSPFILSSSGTAGKALFKRKPSTNLAFNLIAGVSIPFTDSFLAEWSYKYIYLGNVSAPTVKLQIGDSEKVLPLKLKKYKLDTHNVTLGFRYNF